MDIGKLSQEHMMGLFSIGLGAHRRDVVVGPALGLDCAVLKVSDEVYAVVKSDPITFASERIGWYAVQVNANDVATTGADPAWFLSTLLLPPTVEEGMVREVFSQIHRAAKEMGVAVVGGHTEVTPAVEQVLVSATMIGFIKPSELIMGEDVSPGDLILMTKGAAIEATAIIAQDKGDEVSRMLGQEKQREGAAFLDRPGISVLKEARLLRDGGAVKAMHDVTEGGVRAAIYELAKACELGLEFYEASVPIDPLTFELCGCFDLDPLACISSGSLLAALAEEDADAAIEALRGEGIEARVVGKFLSKDRGFSTIDGQGGQRRAMTYQPRDGIGKLFQD